MQYVSTSAISQALAYTKPSPLATAGIMHGYTWNTSCAQWERDVLAVADALGCVVTNFDRLTFLEDCDYVK